MVLSTVESDEFLQAMGGRTVDRVTFGDALEGDKAHGKCFSSSGMDARRLIHDSTEGLLPVSIGLETEEGRPPDPNTVLPLKSGILGRVEPFANATAWPLVWGLLQEPVGRRRRST